MPRGDVDHDAWVDLSQYNTEDLHAIADILQLHPVGINTALSPWKQPRLDVFAEQIFVAATVPLLDTDSYRVQVHQLNLFVGSRFLLSVHQQALPFVERILA